MQSEENVSVAMFIQRSGVLQIRQEFEKTLTERAANGNPLIVSDVYDTQGNQYVDLVQEGGGVWGIALLGYTYILEKAGIRFFSLAGTSAGAINTMLLATAGNKSEEKSEKIIESLLKLDMFSFVDGKKGNGRFTHWVKKQVQKFVLNKDYLNKMFKTILFLIASVCFFSVAACITALLVRSAVLFWFAGTALFFWILIAIVIVFSKIRIRSIIRSGYGLNEGKVFYNWMNDELIKNGIRHLADLKTFFSKVPVDLKLRSDETRDKLVSDTVGVPSSPMMIIVASDITTGNKIEFPRMWDLYWENQTDVSPAAFVRASMSIPIFFETYKIPILPGLQKLKEIWMNHLNWVDDIPHQVSMVDGGVLSNFPINVFYNGKYIIPRMPTFGIRLDDTTGSGSREINSPGTYLGSIIATLRSTTDKDFLIKNKAFTLGVKTVDLTGYSWLNFFMNDDDKQALFRKGAEAAVNFLLQFDWEEYKRQRLENNVVLNEQRKNPNNW